MIGIVDYGMGNLLSVYNAVEMLGADVKLCRNPDELLDVERVILPGVGAFSDCIRNLRHTGLIDALHECIMVRGKPIMGICLGMQVMGRRSFENGEHLGLGWIDADIVRIKTMDKSLRVPQIGWNNIKYRVNSPIFVNLPAAPDYYFVHSYYMQCSDPNNVDATCEYGDEITAAVRKDNICATQFHPEKSQDYGLRVLSNFMNWKP